MSIKKILCATDFSEQAADAAKHAMAIARETGASLVLVHAHTVPSLDFATPYAVATPGFTDEQIKEILADGRRRLRAECDALQGQGVEVSDHSIQDIATQGILRVAEELDVDLIVLGTHGRSGIARFFLGSVAQWIAQRAPCDVLAARDDTPTQGYQRILVPTDFSPCSEYALERAIALSAPGATIELVHFWNIPMGSASYWGLQAAGLREDIINGATEAGNKLIDRESTATLSFEQVEAEARHGIQERIAKGKYDLVVMGSHGLTGVKKLLLGSVAEATLRHSKQSVYIARGKE